MLTETVDTTVFQRKKPFRLGFLNASLGNPWRHALLQSMHYGVRLHQAEITALQVKTADDNPLKQLCQIDELLVEGLDALIVSAADGRDLALSARLETLVKAGFPVVALDRRPASQAGFVSFVTASDAQIGFDSALWLAQHLKGTGRIWLLSGVDGATPTLRRQSAALAAFSHFPGIEIEAVAHTNWTESGGFDSVTALLDQFNKVPDGIWCDSGLQGVGSIRAFLMLNYPIPPHTGGDLNGMYKSALTHHVPCVALDYPASMGAKAIDVVVDILTGRPVMRRLEVPVRTIMPRGFETPSIKADEWAELHVRWDERDDVILSQGPSLPGYRGSTRSSPDGQNP